MNKRQAKEIFKKYLRHIKRAIKNKISIYEPLDFQTALKAFLEWIQEEEYKIIREFPAGNISFETYINDLIRQFLVEKTYYLFLFEDQYLVENYVHNILKFYSITPELYEEISTFVREKLETKKKLEAVKRNFAGKSKLKTYFYTAIVRLVVDYQEKYNVIKKVELNETNDIDKLPSNIKSLLTSSEGVEIKARLENLPDKEKLAFKLYYYDGITNFNALGRNLRTTRYKAEKLVKIAEDKVLKGKRFITFEDLKNYVTDKVSTYAEERRKKQTPNSISHLYIRNQKKESSPLLRNPFTDTLAICDPLRFIGRKTETRRLWALIQDGSVALRGEPKIGKSSMMLHLARKWSSKIIGPINFDQLGSPDDFYKFIARALELESYDWSAICEALESREALFLLDELDIAPKRGITHDDMSNLRAVCESNRDFKILAVSRAPLKEVFPDTGLGSPLYNILQPLTLGLLNREDALSLLEHPWAQEASKFTPATCDDLIIASGLHPFKLQRAAFHCYEYLNDPSYHWKEAFQQDMEQML